MFFDKETDFNYLTNSNNAKIVSCSSQTKGCSATNTLNEERKSIWLSEPSLPQNIIYDLGFLNNKPRNNFRYFGFYCWHAYATNPKTIELHFSKDNKNFQFFGKYEFQLKPGTQFTEIKNYKMLENNYFRFLKVLVKETFGGNRTYLNQVYLLEEISNLSAPTIKNKIHTVYKEKKRAQSPNLIISNLSQNKNDDYQEEEEDVNEMLPKFEDKKKYDLEKDDMDSYAMNRINRGFDNNVEPNYYYENENFYDESNIHDKISNSGFDFRNENTKYREFESKTHDKKANHESEYIPSSNSVVKKNNEKIRKMDMYLVNRDYNSEEPTPINTQSNYKQKDFTKNKKNNKHPKHDIYEGSISENEKEPRSNNFLNLKQSLSPLKKDLNRSQSPHCDNEYLKLENQIKEMQNQINSMNTDFTINRCLTSKSFGLFTGKNTMEKTNINYMNPFIDNLNNKNEKNPSALNIPKINNEEENKYSENLYKDNSNNYINHINTNNARTNSDKKQSLETIQDSNRKDMNTISYISPQNLNLNEPRSSINLPKEGDSDYKTKIQNIENKLGKMENDIGELKGNFNKLYEAIFKLIDIANSKNTKDNVNSLINPSSVNKNDNFHNQNDPSNYSQRNYGNYNQNINDHNNSQRLNTQASKISTNQVNMAQIPSPPQNNFVNSTNSITNSNNDALNFILAECNKLKNQNLNRDYQNDNEYLNSNYNPNYNTNNLNNYNYDNQEVNYFESPRNYRNDILLNSNAINMPYTENPNRKSLITNNYKRNNKIIDGSFNEDEYSNNNNNLTNNKFEEKLLRKLEEKFESMASNIELRMLNNFLKPSIQSLENNIKMNIDELKTRIVHQNTHSSENLKNQDLDESKLQEYSLIKSSSNRNGDGNMETKISEINKLGERLYEKLLEKEKKLNELKNETTSYLKKKINTTNNSNLLNSGG